MKTQLFAPDIDAFAGNLKSDKGYVNRQIYNTYKEIYQVFSCIFPEGTDDVRRIWFEVERGPLEAFGDWKESGEVESQEEFLQLWREYYPSV